MCAEVGMKYFECDDMRHEIMISSKYSELMRKLRWII